MIFYWRVFGGNVDTAHFGDAHIPFQDGCHLLPIKKSIAIKNTPM
jgi:hypothetical protein